MNIELEVRESGLFLAGTDTPVACHWFALCDRQATHLAPHPAGATPACDRCVQIGR